LWTKKAEEDKGPKGEAEENLKWVT